MYDPKSYWEERSNPNARDASEAPGFILDFLRDGVAGADRVLEVGPGVGRTFSVYRPGQEIVTIDLSTRYAQAVTEAASRYGLEIEQYYMAAPDESFPFTDGRFDVCVCCQVLLHVPPRLLERLLGEIMRTCRTAFIVTHIGRKTAEHVFSHDYEKAWTRVGAVCHGYNEFGNTALITLSK